LIIFQGDQGGFPSSTSAGLNFVTTSSLGNGGKVDVRVNGSINSVLGIATEGQIAGDVNIVAGGDITLGGGLGGIQANGTNFGGTITVDAPAGAINLAGNTRGNTLSTTAEIQAGQVRLTAFSGITVGNGI